MYSVYHYFISDSVRHKMLYCYMYMYIESMFVLICNSLPLQGPLIGTIKLLFIIIIIINSIKDDTITLAEEQYCKVKDKLEQESTIIDGVI